MELVNFINDWTLIIISRSNDKESKDLNAQEEQIDDILKATDVENEKLVFFWKFKDVNKKLIYDLNKCVGCSFCKLVCPTDAIELGPVPEIAQGIIENAPYIIIDYDKCCYCMLCPVVCINDVYETTIKPEEQLILSQYPKLKPFFKIDLKKCIKDIKNEICNLCLKVQDGNYIKDFLKIQKECPTKCFKIESPIKGEVIIKQNMLHRCDPTGCKACVNICPTESFFIPETAEDVKKYGKIAVKEDDCIYCGACQNSCPEDLIIVKRFDIEIEDPKVKENFPWIQGWRKNIKRILREKLLDKKEQIQIPLPEEELTIPSEEDYSLEKIPQLSEADKKIFQKLNNRIKSLLSKSKIRYWIENTKIEKIKQELKKSKKK
ncbi:MAG: 4Fe-4S dicluster domain-containing protein [Candidatus Lokiarchaeota archaeon]|nr:4Fe-4S dicluster domain-containing protein [Candidatus Lokiarchaeota archaeon]